MYRCLDSDKVVANYLAMGVKVGRSFLAMEAMASSIMLSSDYLVESMFPEDAPNSIMRYSWSKLSVETVWRVGVSTGVEFI